MTRIMVMQGRHLGESDIGMIRGLLDVHPDWHRPRLSREICERWDWRNAQSQQDMAARTLLLI